MNVSSGLGGYWSLFFATLYLFMSICGQIASSVYFEAKILDLRYLIIIYLFRLVQAWYENFFETEVFVTVRKKLPYGFAVTVVFLLAITAVSCASTGNFMPLAQGETVLGTVQANFTARNTLNGRDMLNTQAYIKLLEVAQRKYEQDVLIDIRDIVWVSGKEIDSRNKEYAATGKVIQVQ
jgi:hypothetical protein